MIRIFIDGRNFGKKYGTSFAIILKSDDHVWERSFDCGGITANEAGLRAVEFGLRSIKAGMRKSPIEVITNSTYVTSMLEKEETGHWKKNAKVNADLIARIRKLLEEQFPKVEILESSDDDLAQKVKDLSALVAKEHQAVDVRG
jgi:ribonuclease HI